MIKMILLVNLIILPFLGTIIFANFHTKDLLLQKWPKIANDQNPDLNLAPRPPLRQTEQHQ